MPIGIKFDDHLNLLKKHNITPYFGGKNNLPDEDSVIATNAILDLIDNVTSGKMGQSVNRPIVFITLITGGASALLVAPKEPLTLTMKRELTRQLMAAGCTINELNCVRSCWSKVKAGQLALRVLSSSTNVEMINFIASDVIGDPIDIIGSGPTVLRPNDSANPLELIDIYKLPVDSSIRDLCQQNVKQSNNVSITDRLHNYIIVSNQVALSAAKNLMNSLGYKVIDLGNQISGDASTLGSRFAQIARTSDNNEGKICWIGGGETVVTLPSNPGKGGRCQEMALRFLVDTFNDQLTNFAFLAGGTDGQDGPTPISGVIYQYNESISSDIYNSAKEYLVNHDSYTFWSTYLPQCMIDTGGPTGVNVMDIYCLIQC
ncbi:uncharacterized protein C13B9.2-like isoform X2 [Panonychus citri]|nr:uncharacterized protein C13B9.2-like isoform X2 [Panonychus citri]